MEGNLEHSPGYDPDTEIVHGLHLVCDDAKMASDHQSAQGQELQVAAVTFIPAQQAFRPQIWL